MANFSDIEPLPFVPFAAGGNVATLPSPDAYALGSKGSGLVDMARLGLPVPPGFIFPVSVGAEAVAALDADKEAFKARVGIALATGLEHVEATSGLSFENGDNPLLVSVRSGGAVSMPGMMDTVLNVGLTRSICEAWATDHENPSFCWDNYRRSLQSHAQVVLNVPADDFELIIEEALSEAREDAVSDLPLDLLIAVCTAFETMIEDSHPGFVARPASERLENAVMAVFASWNTSRARRYRDMHSVSQSGGTGVIIQQMVFGNRDARSCTGVYFTRNPSTGENTPFGEYLPQAQGEEVVSGIRTPMELTEASRVRMASDQPSMERTLPDAFDQLIAVGKQLEIHRRDMQEIEFTVEQGAFFLLQTRTGKRSPKAALAIAVDMAETGIISKEEAINRCSDELLAPMLVNRLAVPDGTRPVVKGLPASPGAVSGPVVFTSEAALEAKAVGQPAILVRPETSPSDVHGMDAAIAVLTSRGGMTSHAAVVARGMAKPCITAAMGLRIKPQEGECVFPGGSLGVGDIISLDGSTGEVFLDDIPLEEAKPTGALATLLSWKNA
ncbi:MAG: PEP/pyruvate-binding domain-containing protein [Pseudomonadota bacterium]